MTIQYIKKKIKPILQDYDITYAALFGSIARGEDNTRSDVDLMVRFGRPMGMFSYMRFIAILEKTLKRNVDVVTEKSINKFVKPYIIADLQTIYEK